MTTYDRQGAIYLASAAAALAGAFATGCSRHTPGAAPSPPPHVVLISIDTLRADHLGCYGYDRETTPRIDALARESTRFAAAYAQASWTLPSHMSLMTSQYPHIHGVERQDQALPDAAVTLAEALSAGGYSTTAFISWVFVSQRFGFAQGFGRFVELLPPPELIDDAGAAGYKAEEVTDRAMRWLARCDRRRPQFLFVHYFDPHIDYEAPEPYTDQFDPEYSGVATGRYGYLKQYIKELHRTPQRIAPRDLAHVRALYDGEIRYTDECVGQLLEAVDRTFGLDQTLVVLTSDHGEELDDHGSMEGHQWTLYEEVVRVPLILRPPGGLSRARVIQEPVALIDVAPTILEAAGIVAPPTFQGASLAGLLRDAADADVQANSTPRPVFGCIDRHNRRQFVRDGSFKLIRTDRSLNRRNVPVQAGYELYDLSVDPAEQHNLFPSDAPEAREMIESLARFMNIPAPAAAAPTATAFDERIRRQIESVGYLGSGEPENDRP